MSINSKKIALAVHKSLRNNEDVDSVFKNLNTYITKNNLEYLIPNIIINLEVLNIDAKKFNTCIISSSHELSDETINNLKEKFSIDSESTKIKIDKSLIGGFTLLHRGIKYDASIINLIKNMKSLLVK